MSDDSGPLETITPVLRGARTAQLAWASEDAKGDQSPEPHGRVPIRYLEELNAYVDWLEADHDRLNAELDACKEFPCSS